MGFICHKKCMMIENKIAIRPPLPSDAQAVFEMVHESVETTYLFQTWCHPGYTVEDAQAWIERSESMRAIGAEYHFVVYQPESNRLIGRTAVLHIDQFHRSAQMGSFIRETERGRGYAGEAYKLTAQFAFCEVKLHRLELLTATHNLSSIRGLEKLGAIREGMIRERLKWNDTYHDAYVYSLLDSSVAYE